MEVLIACVFLAMADPQETATKCVQEPNLTPLACELTRRNVEDHLRHNFQRQHIYTNPFATYCVPLGGWLREGMLK